MSAQTYADEIEEMVPEGQSILAICVGAFGGYHGERGPGLPDDCRDVAIPWEKARPFLNYAYSRGYGGEDCHPIQAWTEGMVIFSVCYDGSTSLGMVERDPCDTEPNFYGG